MRRLLYILLIGFVSVSYGQDAQFSQYFSSPALVNPGIIGIIPEFEFSANYKTGGSEDSGTFLELMQATASYPLETRSAKSKQIGGIAATFSRENRGLKGTYLSQKFLLTGAYSLQLSEISNRFVSFGLQGGVVQSGFNSNAVQWGSQFNQYLTGENGFDAILPAEIIDGQNVYYPVFNFGIVYTAYDNDNLYVRDRSITIGLSADNLNQPITGRNENGDVRKQILYKAFASGKLELSPRFYLYPSFLGTYVGESYQINAGTYLTTLVSSVRSRTSILLHVGSWYRLNDSVILLGGFQFNQIRISGSYDLNTSSQGWASIFGENDPTYEVSLTYTFIRDKSFRKISNPIF